MSAIDKGLRPFAEKALADLYELERLWEKAWEHGLDDAELDAVATFTDSVDADLEDLTLAVSYRLAREIIGVGFSYLLAYPEEVGEWEFAYGEFSIEEVVEQACRHFPELHVLREMRTSATDWDTAATMVSLMREAV